jgi:hypothetical protein
MPRARDAAAFLAAPSIRPICGWQEDGEPAPASLEEAVQREPGRLAHHPIGNAIPQLILADIRPALAAPMPGAPAPYRQASRTGHQCRPLGQGAQSLTSQSRSSPCGPTIGARAVARPGRHSITRRGVLVLRRKVDTNREVQAARFREKIDVSLLLARGWHPPRSLQRSFS